MIDATITSRPYADGDMPRLRRFLAEAWTTLGAAGGFLHVGDLLWQRYIYTDDVGRPFERIAIWEDAAGETLGFAWLQPRELVLQPAAPSLTERSAVIDDMLRWGEERARVIATEAPPSHLLVSAFDDDHAFVEALHWRGFVPTGLPPMRFHERALADPIEEPSPPSGFTIRPLRDETEHDERVAIHQAVWHPSRVTLEAYRRLRTIDGYDPELDLVAAADDGTFAAYAIAWYDPVSHTGLFEPVGARSAFRRRGLTRAVLREGLRRLRERGAATAYVLCDTENPASCALYESVGFRAIHRLVSFQRPIAPC